MEFIFKITTLIYIAHRKSRVTKIKSWTLQFAFSLFLFFHKLISALVYFPAADSTTSFLYFWRLSVYTNELNELKIGRTRSNISS